MFLTNMTDDANIFIYRVWYCNSYRTENKLFYFILFLFLFRLHCVCSLIKRNVIDCIMLCSKFFLANPFTIPEFDQHLHHYAVPD
jgi:hypothetical protein